MHVTQRVLCLGLGTLALSGLLLAMFVAMLSSTVVSNALPVIVADLGGTETGYTWVVVATLLTLTNYTGIQTLRVQTHDGADVINVSLVMPSADPQVRAAIAGAVEDGVIVVAAAGNGGAAGGVAVSNAHGTVTGAAGGVLLRPFARLIASTGDSVTTYGAPWNMN